MLAVARHEPGAVLLAENGQSVAGAFDGRAAFLECHDHGEFVPEISPLSKHLDLLDSQRWGIPDFMSAIRLLGGRKGSLAAHWRLTGYQKTTTSSSIRLRTFSGVSCFLKHSARWPRVL